MRANQHSRETGQTTLLIQRIHQKPITAMAGRVRQPIDEAAFSKFLEQNVPQIKTPIELKQVSRVDDSSPKLFRGCR